MLVYHRTVQTLRRYRLSGLSTSPDTPDSEKIWSEGSILVLSEPGSRPYEGHYIILAILEPVMYSRYIRDQSFNRYIPHLLYVLLHDNNISSRLRISHGLPRSS